MNQEEAILVLSHHPKLGAQSIKKILAADIDIFKSANKLPKIVGEKISCYAIEAVENYSLDDIQSQLNEKNIGYLTMLDDAYPRLLLEIPDCPAILFIKGNVESLVHLGVGIVGSRKYSTYGARVAQKFAFSLATAGLSVVSGLALGIDAIAHQAAVDANGTTVAVLGCGLDRIYPSSNQYLVKSILTQGGAIVSEYPPGTEPFKSNFPARNRIIAGLCRGTLIVEAAKESGALITAMAALEYNRDVYAIPGQIDSPSSEGTNFLIQQGAKLVADPSEIIDDYNIPDREKEKKARDYLPQSEEEKEIIDLVLSELLSSDDIVRRSGRNVAEVSYALTMLEMKGILENVSGTWRRKM